MTERLTSKVALVTGGGNGIGAAICKRFAEEGATVVVTDIDLDSAQRVAEEISACGGKAVAREQDVTNPDLWNTLLDGIIQDFGSLDVLVNNAGIGVIMPIEQETLEGWRRMQSVNMESVFLGTQGAIRVMKSHGGSIVNISSIEGIIGEPLVPAYNASKGGVRIFTKSAALHCAQEGYAIRVNSVHPGYVGTAMFADGLAVMPPEQAQALQQELLARIPLGRFGEAVEIANTILFLASDESSYMTGSELVVDGGYTAR
jgi:NAD(P)-dependent dehydrogenase (short-subunit alcohol dehydrogenase family)